MTITQTNILGAGLAPAGISFAGYGTPGSIRDPNRQDLIINEGPDKGKLGDCRLIDPVTKDYVYNDNGYMAGGHGVPQQVYLAISTLKGSSSVIGFGQTFGNLKVIGSNFASQITAEVNNALSDLISKKKIALRQVVVTKQGTRTGIDIQWTDLTTNTDLTTSI